MSLSLFLCTVGGLLNTQMSSSTVPIVCHVWDNLYIGNLLGASDEKTMNEYKIQAVLSILDEKGFAVSLPHLLVPVKDTSVSPLLDHFKDQMYEWMQRHKGKRLLVHCEKGQSRSATVVIAYMMKVRAKSFRMLLDELKKIRPECQPNSGFCKQLRAYQDELGIPDSGLLVPWDFDEPVSRHTQRAIDADRVRAMEELTSPINVWEVDPVISVPLEHHFANFNKLPLDKQRAMLFGHPFIAVVHSNSGTTSSNGQTESNNGK